LDMRLRDYALTDELLREIPNAELHIHIEGSFEPNMMFEMAARNGVRLRHGSVRDEEFRAVAENSFQASFLGEGAKYRLLEELESYVGM
jgi:adenosine deaminase